MRDSHTESRGNRAAVIGTGHCHSAPSCLPHELHLPREGTKLAWVKGGSLGLKEHLKFT